MDHEKSEKRRRHEQKEKEDTTVDKRKEFARSPSRRSTNLSQILDLTSPRLFEKNEEKEEKEKKEKKDQDKEKRIKSPRSLSKRATVNFGDRRALESALANEKEQEKQREKDKEKRRQRDEERRLRHASLMLSPRMKPLAEADEVRLYFFSAPVSAVPLA